MSNDQRSSRTPGTRASEAAASLSSPHESPHQLNEAEKAAAGRRVEIVLDPDLYDRVRIKAMRQRKSLRSLGAELFAAWADDELASGNAP